MLSNLLSDDCPYFAGADDDEGHESSSADLDVCLDRILFTLQEDLIPHIQVLALKLMRDVFKLPSEDPCTTCVVPF